MDSCGPLDMDEQRQDGQLEPTYSNSVPIRDVTLKTCRKKWTIGRVGERGSGIAVKKAWCDDDDNDDAKKIFSFGEMKDIISQNSPRLLKRLLHSCTGGNVSFFICIYIYIYIYTCDYIQFF